MAMIKREILTSRKVLYTKSYTRNQFLFCKKMLFISVLGILTLFRDICYINKFVFRSVRKSKVPPYLKYLLLRDKGWCLQAVRTAGHTLDSTSKPLLVS